MSSSPGEALGANVAAGPPGPLPVSYYRDCQWAGWPGPGLFSHIVVSHGVVRPSLLSRSGSAGVPLPSISRWVARPFLRRRRPDHPLVVGRPSLSGCGGRSARALARRRRRSGGGIRRRAWPGNWIPWRLLRSPDLVRCHGPEDCSENCSGPGTALGPGSVRVRCKPGPRQGAAARRCHDSLSANCHWPGYY